MNQLDTALPTEPAAAALGRTRPTKTRLTKTRLTRTRLTKTATIAVLALTLGACNALTRLSQVGEAPPLTAIQNPAVLHGNQPIAMPMPPPLVVERKPNSLWRPGSRAFLKDQRASEVGDILTVVIEIKDDASISNSTSRSRTAGEDASAASILGYEASLAQFLPSAINPTSLIDLDSSSLTQGAGSVNRDETINLRIAALVTQVLPNGNLVIAGRQEIRVNFEVRELQVAGLIRPEDITSTNTINYDQIAEARIVYGGRGQISDVQQPRYGQQIYDIIWPF
ncbi:MAG: flagellar basal body L-ring protein FlgH [Proteobacteria bacterium]|nr:flagellar basal body L-ring protein FlgH [Pseudomonadota bacterium]